MNAPQESKPWVTLCCAMPALLIPGAIPYRRTQQSSIARNCHKTVRPVTTASPKRKVTDMSARQTAKAAVAATTATVTPARPARTPRTPKPALAIVPETPAVTKPAVTKPAVTKPAAPTMDAAIAKQVAGLESMASKLLAKTMVDLDQLANTVAKIYPLAPWTYATDTRKVMSIAQYARDVLGIKADGFNFAKFTEARRIIVKAVYQHNPEAPTADALAMVGTSGDKTIYRDKDALGLSNPNRQDGGKRAAKTAGKTPAAPKAAKPATAPVPAGAMKLSMTSVRAFISELSDVEMLEELSDLIAERIAAL